MLTDLQHFTDGMVSDVKDVQGGAWRLVCTCSRYGIRKHCNHIEYVMGNRADAANLAELSDASIDAQVVVPIFTDPPLKIHAQVLAAPNPNAFTEVTLIASQATVVGLGYLMKGYGRADIRVMFYEWALGQIEAEVHSPGSSGWEDECRSPHHSRDTSNVLAGYDEADKWRLKEIIVDWWYLNSTEQCSDCATATHVDIF